MLRKGVPSGYSRDCCRIGCGFQGLVGLVYSPDERFFDDEVEGVNADVAAEGVPQSEFGSGQQREAIKMKIPSPVHRVGQPLVRAFCRELAVGFLQE